MKRGAKSLLASGVAVVAAISVWVLFARPGASDLQDSATATTQADEHQVAYPPALPYEPAISIDALATKAPKEKSTDTEEVNLCGYGLVSEAQLPAELEQAAARAMFRVIEDLEASKEERQRALGLSMHTMVAGLRASARASGWDAQNCFFTDVCDDDTRQAQHRAAAPAAEALARLAASTLDPQTYGSAMRACRFIDVRASADCSALSPEQWARLDPQNGFAWLEVAAAARKRRDFVANDEAMRQASRSTVIDWRATPYGEFLAKVDTPSEPTRTLVLSLLSTAYTSEERIAPYADLLHYCQRQVTNDELRRQVCNDLWQLLLEQDPGLAWSNSGPIMASDALSAKAQSASAELGALRALAAATIPTAEPLSCNWAAQATQWLQGTSRYGERGYLSKLLKEQTQTSAGKTSAPLQR